VRVKATNFWREVETGDADRLEFRLGGERVMVSLGIASLVVGVVGSVVVLSLVLPVGLPFLWHTVARIVNGRPLPVGWSELLDEGLFVTFMWSVGLGPPIAIGLINTFRRGQIVVNRTTIEIAKSYRFLSFRADRTYDSRNVSSISFSWNSGRWRFLGCQAVCLDSESQQRRRLLVVAWADRKKGREMAERIAGFLGVSCPLDRVSVK
jgi:hypothetical protein